MPTISYVIALVMVDESRAHIASEALKHHGAKFIVISPESDVADALRSRHLDMVILDAETDRVRLCEIIKVVVDGGPSTSIHVLPSARVSLRGFVDGLIKGLLAPW